MFRATFRQAYYYGYGIFKGEPNPHHVSAYEKFNAPQSMTYPIIMLLAVPLQFVTGVPLWDLKRFSGMVDFFGGVRVVDTVHVLLWIFFTAFLFIHPYLASLGHTTFGHANAAVDHSQLVKGPGALDLEVAPESRRQGVRPRQGECGQQLLHLAARQRPALRAHGFERPGRARAFLAPAP